MANYTSSDPRFPEHCRTASERQRWKLFQEEIAVAKDLLRRGRNFECVSEGVLRRELKANGVDTIPVRAEKRVKRGIGVWRSHDPTDLATLRLD
jgi:hypothetical protein